MSTFRGHSPDQVAAFIQMKRNNSVHIKGLKCTRKPTYSILELFMCVRVHMSSITREGDAVSKVRAA